MAHIENLVHLFPIGAAGLLDEAETMGEFERGYL
jgi:hypothetical protein